MKIKALILIAFVAIITLSFSFATTNSRFEKTTTAKTTSIEVDQPIRGFIAEDKF